MDTIGKGFTRVVGATGPWRAVLVALTLGVGWLALTPLPPAAVDLGWDKLNHACAFAALALSGRLGYPGRRAAWIVIGAALAFGALIELLQLFVPGRSSEWADVAADAVGIAFGAIVASGFLELANGRSRVESTAAAAPLR